MKKLRLLGLVGLMLGSFVFSCTLPMEVIEPKINGVKINKKIGNITSLSVDEDENLYIVEKNLIKKLDSKTNELTTIAGREKPDDYPEDGVIDGDNNTAKFGKISNLFFIKKENAIYFKDTFQAKRNIEHNGTISRVEIQRFFYRKIVNNKVESITKENILYFSLSGEKYIIEDKKLVHLSSYTLIKSNTNIPIIPDEFRPYELIIDNTGFVYLTNINGFPPYEKSIYIVNNNEWKKIFSTMNSFINFFLDNNDNLYFIKSPLITDFEGNVLSGKYDPTLIHKIPKKDLLSKSIDIENRNYVIGSLPKMASFITISYNGKNFYALKELTNSSNELYKIKLGE